MGMSAVQRSAIISLAIMDVLEMGIFRDVKQVIEESPWVIENFAYGFAMGRLWQHTDEILTKDEFLSKLEEECKSRGITYQRPKDTETTA